ncbi:MAG: S41 family peptidase [Acidobacteriaceae bacterium]|nr:S41 family peptidase [Acidobacteriaceae bacterium]
MVNRTRRAVFTASLFLAGCAVAGSLLGGRVAAQSASDESTLRDSMKQFTDAYSVVEANYADKLNTDQVDKAIYDGAIPGMLDTLDPHSSFFDPKAFAKMREDQQGKYFGVGMTIQPQGNKIVVVAPFEGTPSYRAGIRPGDVFLSIDGKSTEKMDSSEVASLLKGPRGTHVVVTMAREGSPKPLTFDLVRDEIPHLTVDLSIEIKPHIGYVHIASFSSETTAKELQDDLDKFGPGLQGLLIDLRSNPGGLLNMAVDVCDKFLQKGQIVVSQRGRAFPDQVYRAPHGSDAKYPIVILVNRNTASAAEIVSGALQDHDRALIVGETTFGKGLVQTVFPIAENTGLALTTYHYYTPSGRLIQRDYAGESRFDYFYVRDDAAPANNTNKEVKLTDSGRTVYGGGGITPDEKIPEIKSTHQEDVLLQHYAFFNFSKHWLATHPTVPRDFVVDDAVMADFKNFLKDQKIEYTDKDLNDCIDWVKTSIKAELFTAQFGQMQGMAVRVNWDPQIAKALTYMPEAQALFEHKAFPAASGNTKQVAATK